MKSIVYNNPPIISGWYSVAGKKESEGPLGRCFDVASDDDNFGGSTWEEAESRMQNIVVKGLLERTGIDNKAVDCIVAGDLLGQLIATSWGVKDFNVPLFGVYGACSTMGEAIAIASLMADSPYADNVIAMTSSHYATAEKQFRFPLGYGNQRPLSATTTVTGSGGILISSAGTALETGKDATSNNKRICIKGITIGTIKDYGIKDANNMGAAMAPAAYSTIKEHFADNNTGPEEYDKIITGDLGGIGSGVLYEMLKSDGIDISEKHLDCGNMIYDRNRQDSHSGGSGCGCSAITLCGFFLPRMQKGEFKRILFVPTGALLSTVSSHEGNSIPAIAHGIVFEAMDNDF